MCERYGFKILAMWLSKEDDQLRFVYLLTWPDLATKEASWAAFMADEEWSEIKRISRSQGGGEPVLSVEDILLDAVPFSAALDVAS